MTITLSPEQCIPLFHNALCNCAQLFKLHTMRKRKPKPVCIGFRPNEYRVYSVDNKGRGYIHSPGYATYADAQAAVLQELAYPYITGSWVSQDIEPIYQ